MTEEKDKNKPYWTEPGKLNFGGMKAMMENMQETMKQLDELYKKKRRQLVIIQKKEARGRTN